MWQLKQLEKLREIEPDVVDGAIQMLLEREIALKEKLIIGAYMDGDINFGKTAELLNIHPVKRVPDCDRSQPEGVKRIDIYSSSAIMLISIAVVPRGHEIFLNSQPGAGCWHGLCDC